MEQIQNEMINQWIGVFYKHHDIYVEMLVKGFFITNDGNEYLYGINRSGNKRYIFKGAIKKLIWL